VIYSWSIEGVNISLRACRISEGEVIAVAIVVIVVADAGRAER
jgi:hypothetical protein